MVKKRKGVYADCLKMEHPMRLIEVDGKVKNQVSGKIGDSDLINGIPCSSGYKIGVARVLKNFAEGSKLQKNEILVTHSANPGWVPLYLLASGIVTEIGGALSHSAIIAREYGIPMVASVSNACKNIKTGDHISIDGTNGIVKKL
jgi:phosphoenolpyruvate synthase/pyruvate phosphate dikinase